MDNDLAANDPYRNMDSGEEGIQPDFLKKGGGAGKALAAAENVAGAVAAAKGGKVPGNASGNPTANAAKAEDAADKKGFYNKSGADSETKEGDESQPGFNTEGLKKALLAASPVLILVGGLFGIIFLIIGLPVLMIGGIDYNLQRVLGFEHTISILEKEGETVTAEMLAKGKVPKNYFNDLVAHGIDVGQITANGDFVRTDIYIANIENRNDLIASAGGFSYISEDEGELAMLFDGEVIRADDFIARVESNPVLYAAYSDAADLDTKYYYSEEVNDVYKEMDLSRGNFNGWKTVGNYAEDEQSFNKMLIAALNNGTDMILGGSHRDAEKDTTAAEKLLKVHVNSIEHLEEGNDAGPGTFANDVTNKDGEYAVEEMAENVREYVVAWEFPPEIDVEESEKNGQKKATFTWKIAETSHDATQRAAELLNTAISSGEPYLAANAFIVTEEAIQRARVDGDGPVNLVMNTLTRGKTVEYQDIETGEIKTSNIGILETDNFRAAVSDSKYSQSEALNFSTDRVLKITEQADHDIIKHTTVSSDGKPNSSSVVRNGKTEFAADEEIISKATESVTLSQANKNTEVFQSVVGGNRIIEGGSFVSNNINMKVIGAMPSNSFEMAKYYEVVKDAMARRDEAERATKSPFDISSPNTFFGSIVHNITTAVLGNYNSGLTALSAVTSAGNVAGKAVAMLTGNATAYGGDDEFVTMNGTACETVGAVATAGNLYCTSHNAISTEYLEYTLEDFMESDIGEDIDDEGEPKEDSELLKFKILGMDRPTTVGVRSAEICKRVKDDEESLIAKFFTAMKSQMDPMYDTCEDVDPNIATGQKYTFGSGVDDEQLELNKLYSSYMLYDEVKSLLSDEPSKVSIASKKYYAKHPKDDSRAGKIARRSGMTKHEAEVALAYADYLNMIANYDASDRFAFAAPVVVIEKPILQYHSDEMALELYAWYSKQTEYDDLRTRNFVV